MENYLIHYGVMGQKWGVRRYQNQDGSLTGEGRNHYGVGDRIKAGFRNAGNSIYGGVKNRISYSVNKRNNNIRLANTIANSKGGAYKPLASTAALGATMFASAKAAGYLSEKMTKAILNNSNMSNGSKIVASIFATGVASTAIGITGNKLSNLASQKIYTAGMTTKERSNYDKYLKKSNTMYKSYRNFKQSQKK